MHQIISNSYLQVGCKKAYLNNLLMENVCSKGVFKMQVNMMFDYIS